MSILKTENLRKYYGSGESLVKALDGVDVSVEQGEFVAVVGTSGSGKSTLLHMMGGLDNPTSGSVRVDGKEIAGMSPDELTVFRRRQIGFVFQNYNLVPMLNVYENIVLPIELDGSRPDKELIDDIVNMLCSIWGTGLTVSRTRSREASSSAWPSRGRSRLSRRSSSRTSRREIWTAGRGRRSSGS